VKITHLLSREIASLHNSLEEALYFLANLRDSKNSSSETFHAHKGENCFKKNEKRDYLESTFKS